MWIGYAVYCYPGPTSNFETWLGPPEPYFMRMYEKRPGGIYQVGDTRFGTYPEPVLLVPDTVRVGMRWTGAPFGAHRFTFEVVERVKTDTEVTWYGGASSKRSSL